MYLIRLISTLAGLAAIAAAQPASFNIRAFAGAPRFSGDGGQATSAVLWSPRGVAVDAAGNIFVADTGNAKIRKVAIDGTITTVAGVNAGFAGDGGPAAQAQFA